MATPNWFIALPVPLTLDLSALAPPPSARVFAPGDLHLTVAFLGPVSLERALEAFAAAQPFPLRKLGVSLSRVCALGPKHRPSAFSALLSEGRAEVEAAVGAVRDRICDVAGVRRDPRPPLAHVTLARPRRAATMEERRALARWVDHLELPPCRTTISQVALYTWSDDRARALFRVERAQELEEPLGGL